MKTGTRRLNIGLLALVLVFSLLVPYFSWGQDDPPSWGEPKWVDPAERVAKDQKLTFSEKTDGLLTKIATVFQARLRTFAEHLNQKKNVNLKIKNTFYDKQLRRIFVDFEGSALFTGKLPFKLKLTDYYLTSDGPIAWDLTVEKMVSRQGGVYFSYHGDLVLSLDKILSNLVQEVVKTAGVVVLSQIGDELLSFLQNFDLDLLAKAISKSFEKFSRETLSVSAAEAAESALRFNNKTLAARITTCAKNGTMIAFIGVTLFKTTTISLASITGATFGAMAGNLLLPGAGGLVGAFLGKEIMEGIAKTIVSEVTVEIPIEISLNRLVKYQKILSVQPSSELARTKLQTYSEFIFKKVRKEIDHENYHTFDWLLKKMDKFESSDRKAFITLLSKLGEQLRFKLIEEKDWYAAKKLNQMRFQMKNWGLPGLFGE